MIDQSRLGRAVERRFPVEIDVMECSITFTVAVSRDATSRQTVTLLNASCSSMFSLMYQNSDTVYHPIFGPSVLMVKFIAPSSWVRIKERSGKVYKYSEAGITSSRLADPITQIVTRET